MMSEESAKNWVTERFIEQSANQIVYLANEYLKGRLTAKGLLDYTNEELDRR